MRVTQHPRNKISFPLKPAAVHDTGVNQEMGSPTSESFKEESQEVSCAVE